MLCLYGGVVSSVNPKVCLQIAFGGEGPATDLTLEESLSSVGPVMHQEGTLTGE